MGQAEHAAANSENALTTAGALAAFALAVALAAFALAVALAEGNRWRFAVVRRLCADGADRWYQYTSHTDDRPGRRGF